MRFGPVLVLSLFATAASAFPEYPNAIPNGATFACANCHVNPAGGGARTPFGEDVRENRDPNNIYWDVLYSLDSDGDGQTNGQELNDPCGTWSPGDPNPAGDNLSNPGDAFSSLGTPPDTACVGEGEGEGEDPECSSDQDCGGALVCDTEAGLCAEPLTCACVETAPRPPVALGGLAVLALLALPRRRPR